jgi:hypothetical protein
VEALLNEHTTSWWQRRQAFSLSPSGERVGERGEKEGRERGEKEDS